jgi:hypothetical protein
MQMQRMNELDSKAHVFESRGELLKAIAVYQAEYEDLFTESTFLGTRTSIGSSFNTSEETLLKRIKQLQVSREKQEMAKREKERQEREQRGKGQEMSQKNGWCSLLKLLKQLYTYTEIYTDILMYIYIYRRNNPSSKPERRQRWKEEQVCV